MGCGSSTDAVPTAGRAITSNGRPRNNPISTFPTNGVSHHLNSSNGSFNLIYSEKSTSHKTSPDKLPPPKPPGTSKSDLLQYASSISGQYDPTKISPTSKQSLEAFTTLTLLPDKTTELHRSVNIVEISKEPSNDVGFEQSGHANASAGAGNLSARNNPFGNSHTPVEGGKDKTTPKAQLKPSTQPDGAKLERGQAQASFHVPAAAYESQVKKQMEEHLELQKRASLKLDNDKKMRQQSLKEKLKKRSEIKQKQRKEAAAGAEKVSFPTEEVSTAPPEWEIRDLVLEPVPTEAAPQPTIPITNKEFLYKEEDIELFSDLEHHAVVKMEKVTSESVTFATLMDNLLIIQLSDLEKVRILFHWITAQDLNAINFPSQVQEDTPLGFLLAIKEDRKTYATLFVRLCGAAGLHGKLITGFLKGVGYYPDYKFGGMEDPFRGSWNAVLIDGQWRLIDTNWGARHVTEDDEQTSDTWKTEYKYEEHYFLTDPDKLIDTHFPDEVDWQLLQNPSTKGDFEKSVKVWPLFYKLKLDLLSHKEGVIEADRSGYVKVQLKISPFARTDAQFKAELKPRFKESNQDLELLERSLFHYTDVDLETFEVFLPTTGQYLFKIFALSSKYGEPKVFTNLCSYQISCPQITSSPQTPILPPFPVVSMFYGVSVINAQLVARPKSHKGARIECDGNGEARIVLSVVARDRDVAFTHDLFDSSIPTLSLEDRVVHSHNEENGSIEVIFFVRVPRPGNYALALYSNVKDTSSTTFTPFCFYLLTSTKQKQENVEFPRIPNKVIGRLQPSFNALSLEVKSCYPSSRCDWKSGFLKTDDNGECCIFLGHSKPLAVVVEFSSHLGADLNDCTSVESYCDTTAIVIRPPIQETGDSPCSLKIYAAQIDQTQNLPSVYIAIVFSEADINRVLPYPQCPIRTWGLAGITSIKYGLKEIKFRNSQPTLQKMCDDSDLNKSGPTRNYNGGEDFALDLELSRPLQLKAKLQDLNDNPEDLQNFILLEKVNANSATIRIRFVRVGNFSLVVYGCAHDDKSGQLSPLVYSLVYVSVPSACTLEFPIAFGVWGSSACHLYSPLHQELERNQEIKLKVFLGNYQKSDDDWSVVPYPEVMVLADGNQPVTTLTTSGCDYEWTYVAGPGEKVLGILVKQEQESDSMTYALQFKIA